MSVDSEGWSTYPGLISRPTSKELRRIMGSWYHRKSSVQTNTINHVNLDASDMMWKNYNPADYGNYVLFLFFILNTKTHKMLAFVSAQHMNSYLEPWQSLLTIQGSQNMLAASLIFENSVNLTFFLAINMPFNSCLISFHRDANATRIDIYTGMSEKDGE